MLGLRCSLPLVVASLVLGAALPGVALAENGYPNVMNYYLSNTMDQEKYERLAEWDVVVLDADFQYENPTGLATLRSLNPGITILAFIPFNGASSTGWQRPPETVLYKHWEGCQNGDFWLYDTSGGKVSDWPGKWTANLTPNCPTNGTGQTYAQWFPAFVRDEVWLQGGWDGLFLDTVWDEIDWVNAVHGTPIDSDGNAIADPASTLNSWWYSTSQGCMSQIRTLIGSNVPIMSNGSNTYYSLLNGNMVENFPPGSRPPDQNNPYGYDWTPWMFTEVGAYLSGLSSYDSTPMQLSTIDAAWDIGNRDNYHPSAAFYRHHRLTLGSALLGDGYYSFHWATYDHASLWWTPFYDIHLGPALGPAYTVDVNGATVWRRDYQDAIVVVNPNNDATPVWIDMPSIAGWDAFIGPKVTTDVPTDALGPKPGRVLLRQAQPNPFRAGTSIGFTLSEPAHVKLALHDVQGRLVTTLVDQAYEAGEHAVSWDGEAGGRILSPGVYFAVLEAGNQVRSVKLLKE